MSQELTPLGFYPVLKGPLSELEQIRPELLKGTVSRTMKDFTGASLDVTLGEALYSERFRLKRSRPNWFTKKRDQADKRLWNRVQSGLLLPAGQADRSALLESVVNHYAEEIGGHYNERVYRFATHVVPFGFNWLLNAASVNHFKPWGMTEQVSTRLKILGEVPHLQRLSKLGTILIVPTHQSNIDSILIGYLIYLMGLPAFSYGAGLNLYSNPVLSFFMSHLGAYTVDRQKRNEIYIQTLKNYSTRLLQQGVHSIFFPGGGRSRSGAIEKKLKLGLMGTALDAQIENYRTGNPKPSIFIVPMVMSYHFVLEASSLIEDYLAESGKHRFIITDDESWQPTQVMRFFWRIFKSQSGIGVRIGKPMDVFGNFVDENGKSIGPNGTTIDPARWLTTAGELKPVAQRDHEYTKALGEKVIDRFHKENLVLTSHAAAFVYFEALRAKYPDLDLYRFLRLSIAQRTMSYSEFLERAQAFQARMMECEKRGDFFLSSEFHMMDLDGWVKDGITQLGLLHDAAVLRVGEGTVWTEDMNLLYYYRNRLTGYGLSTLAEYGGPRGQNDVKGFLA